MRALILLGLVGCASVSGNDKMMVVSGALLACDYGQTITRPSGTPEHNPLLGEAPSPAALTAYFAAILVVGGMASMKAPEWLRGSLYSMVILGESSMVLGNRYLANTGWCGL